MTVRFKYHDLAPHKMWFIMKTEMSINIGTFKKLVLHGIHKKITVISGYNMYATWHDFTRFRKLEFHR